MILKWDITIPRLSGDQTRRAYVYLPESYDEDPERRYPVMYFSTDTTCSLTRTPPSEPPGAWMHIWRAAERS